MGCILMPKAKASSSLSSSPPVHGRSVYIHKALADPSLVGQAKEMKELYTKQVRSEVAKGHVVPERSCATPSGPGVVALRTESLITRGHDQGSEDDEKNEKNSLLKKQTRFANQVVVGFHGEAWRAHQDLVAKPKELKAVNGYQKVFAATDREGLPDEVFATAGEPGDDNEAEQLSDAGAWVDDEIFEAFAAASLGHCAGDAACGKGGRGSPKKDNGKGNPSRKGGRSSKGKAYLAGDSFLHVSLNDGEENGLCDMILDKRCAGDTELDAKRKHATPKAHLEVSASSTAEWEFVGKLPPFRSRTKATTSRTARPAGGRRGQGDSVCWGIQTLPGMARQLSPMADDPGAEAREAKRQKVTSSETASFAIEHFDSVRTAKLPRTLEEGQKLSEVTEEQQQLFTGPGGSDEREWKGAKSRLVVQGFKDKALGQFRRYAPTASAVAESVCLALRASKGFLLFAKDIKNTCFSGKGVVRSTSTRLEEDIMASQLRCELDGVAQRVKQDARVADLIRWKQFIAVKADDWIIVLLEVICEIGRRIVQWNLNCLCGIDGQSPQRAADVIKVLAPCNADVLVLQEMPRGPAQSWWWEPWRSTFPAEEMRALETGLQELGYQTQLRSSCFSSTLLCTRLTVVAVSEASLDSEHDFRMPEDRAALLVSLRLEADADSLIVTICATHFHHQNFTVNDKGVRKAEAELLLRHCATNTPSDSQCTLMVADFNQARRGDYSAEEWSVISAGLHSIKEPEDDGVAELLTSQGWVCAYDIAAERNWRGASPPFTHWTGTTVDYTYMLAPADRAKVSAHLLHSDVSDHLPIMTHVSF
ncbi:hypothetical protein AK812_SmicGene25029 [Symbiodinium microadriaticum]|uniref:Endonuclease/exonuclease/phosphatase domain-containing protein n=1 Tax=Symbiodinium microadriaticum TaxID=2951 RepID=A0A1Q9DD81_SYMMI|nr:hypothetical protein AK812_SmicGene25029 [Symbiodinium microadriaticum]